MSPIPLGIFATAGAGAAGGAPAYELISTTILGSDTASVTFNNSGAWNDYKHLQIRSTIRTTGSVDTTLGYLRVNGASNDVYTIHTLNGNGSTVSSSANVPQNRMHMGWWPGANSAANIFSADVVDILDINSTGKNTIIRSLSGVRNGDPSIGLASGSWMNTTVPSYFTILPPGGNLRAGSRISLYGIKG